MFNKNYMNIFDRLADDVNKIFKDMHNVLNAMPNDITQFQEFELQKRINSLAEYMLELVIVSQSEPNN